ncbi:MAG TPA: hypothetical protein VLH60_07225 [Sedimentisphaerales bacterium]|nr:hypothetical protein [Sedimentisphaerales bacterium]
MDANKFSVDRVDSLAGISGATPAGNEKDRKHRNQTRSGGKQPGNAESSQESLAGDLSVETENRTVDYQA